MKITITKTFPIIILFFLILGHFQKVFSQIESTRTISAPEIPVNVPSTSEMNEDYLINLTIRNNGKVKVTNEYSIVNLKTGKRKDQSL
jgi:uncharacterized BrkB/YihY/UPF0761 family membrane protein